MKPSSGRVIWTSFIKAKFEATREESYPQCRASNRERAYLPAKQFCVFFATYGAFIQARAKGRFCKSGRPKGSMMWLIFLKPARRMNSRAVIPPKYTPFHGTALALGDLVGQRLANLLWNQRTKAQILISAAHSHPCQSREAQNPLSLLRSCALLPRALPVRGSSRLLVLSPNRP